MRESRQVANQEGMPAHALRLDTALPCVSRDYQDLSYASLYHIDAFSPAIAAPKPMNPLPLRNGTA